MRRSARIQGREPDPGPTRPARTGPPRPTPAPPRPSMSSGTRQIQSTDRAGPVTRQGPSSGPLPQSLSRPGPELMPPGPRPTGKRQEAPPARPGARQGPSAAPPRPGSNQGPPAGPPMPGPSSETRQGQPPERHMTPPTKPMPKRRDEKQTPPRAEVFVCIC